MVFLMILWLVCLTGMTTGITFGSIFDKFDDGFRWMQILVIAFLMSSGIFANVSKGGGSAFVYYLQFVSPTRYGVELMMKQELLGRNPLVNKTLLNYLGFDWSQWRLYSFLVAYCVFMFFVGYLVLLYKSRNF